MRVVGKEDRIKSIQMRRGLKWRSEHLKWVLLAQLSFSRKTADCPLKENIVRSTEVLDE